MFVFVDSMNRIVYDELRNGIQESEIVTDLWYHRTLVYKRLLNTQRTADWISIGRRVKFVSGWL
jgi:hypothetical protein